MHAVESRSGGAVLRMLSAFGAAMLAIAPSQTSAQDGSEPGGERTPENAQTFLVESLSRYGAHAQVSLGFGRGTYLNNKNKIVFEDSLSEVEHWGAYPIARIEPLSRCVTRLHLQNSGAFTGTGLFPTTQFFLSNKNLQTLPTVDLDWSQIENIENASNAIFHQLKGFIGEGPRLIFTDRNLFGQSNWIRLAFANDNQEASQRLNFAITYLKDVCAPKSTTGF